MLTSLFLVACNAYSQESFFSKKNADIQPPEYGCTIKDVLYPAGTRKAMNHEELELYKEKTGFYPSDGYAIMMECLYLVNPLNSDHPKPKDRKYVWVAS